MNKILALLIPILFSFLTSRSQTNQSKFFKDAVFCGKTGESNPTKGFYTIEELQNCDFKIITLDSDFTVTEFQLTLIMKDQSHQNLEKKIYGDEIPKEYRTQILKHTQNVFLEHIKAADKKGQTISIKPIAVRIN